MEEEEEVVRRGRAAVEDDGGEREQATGTESGSRRRRKSKRSSTKQFSNNWQKEVYGIGYNYKRRHSVCVSDDVIIVLDCILMGDEDALATTSPLAVKA